jgi:hypothetical protein
MSRKIMLGFALLATVSLTACGGSIRKEIEEDARYWQRIDTTDSIYQRGPKAQQMLFQDMAGCTAEINELRRLGAIRNAVPAETFDKGNNRIEPNSPQDRMARWDTPERDGALRSEHKPYSDFETCMTYKGWERVEFVNYETKERARDDYLDAIGYERYRSTVGERVKKDDYQRLNNK